MFNIMSNNDYLSLAVETALKAGDCLLNHFHSSRLRELNIGYKEDQSPVTIADREANNIILKNLSRTTIPVISEEEIPISYDIRSKWELIWIVDPLDGTKEFINGSDEFTVNISLIRDQAPVLGIIYCPAKGLLYFSSLDLKGAFRYLFNYGEPVDVDLIIRHAERLSGGSDQKEIIFLTSRSHTNDATRIYLEDLKKKFGPASILYKGSSLKFCMIAEGTAHVYPRLGTTYEWDTAAGQAILEAVGGQVLNIQDQQPLKYNKPGLFNPGFVAFSKTVKPVLFSS